MNEKNVRLSDEDLRDLIFCFKKHFLEHDRLWLFGSRADLAAKGGDIDLYIETHIQNIVDALQVKMAFLIELEGKIGEQKIDVVLNILNHPHQLPIYEIAKTQGVRII